MAPFMEPDAHVDYDESIRETVAQLRMDPETAWRLDLLHYAGLALLLLLLIPSVRRVWDERRMLSGTVRAWGAFFGAYVWWSLIAPDIAYRWIDDRRVWFDFPEGPHAMIMLFIGWLPGFIVAFATLIIRETWDLIHRIRNRRTSP